VQGGLIAGVGIAAVGAAAYVTKLRGKFALGLFMGTKLLTLASALWILPPLMLFDTKQLI
jgi:hypothetical protein